MDPTSPEARTILRFYDLTYDEVMFYESHHQIGKYLLLAGITVMVWDHIVSIPEEIKYVWQVTRRWTSATALFVFNRYISPLGFIFHFIQFLLQNADRPLCEIGDLTGYLNIASFACVEIGLMLRVWVMYGKSKKLGLFLGAIFVGAFIASFILPSKQPLTDIALIPSFPMVLTICMRSPPSAYFWLIITALSVETITFSLFCTRVYIAWKDSMTTPILSALFKQGATYYVVILCTFATFIPATLHKEMYIPLADSNLVILISCIACNRLILSLRGLYYSGVAGVSTTSETLTQGDSTQLYPPSGEVITSLDTTAFAVYDKEKMA